MEKLDRIQINPKICLGQPVVRGTRIIEGPELRSAYGQRNPQIVSQWSVN